MIAGGTFTRWASASLHILVASSEIPSPNQRLTCRLSDDWLTPRLYIECHLLGPCHAYCGSRSVGYLCRRDLSSCAFTVPPTEGAGLQGYLYDPVQGERIASAVDRLDIRDPKPETRRVSSPPWGLVVSTAVDTSLARALNETNRDARRVRHHFVDQALTVTLPKRPNLLDVLQLARVSDLHRPLGQLPYGRRWRQVQRLSQPGLLKELATQIGPAHTVCVAGLGLGNVVDWRLVASSLTEVDPERIVWLLDPANQLPAEELLAELPGITLVHDSLDAILQAAEAISEEQHHLSHLKSTVLDTNDLVVTVGTGSTIRPIVFRSAELRDFRRYVEVLPDMSEQQKAEQGVEWQVDFVNFLSRPRIRPDYENISRGFCFARDAYNNALEHINRRLRQKPSDLPNGRKGPQSSGPILLVGGAGSGRTMGLHWLGWRLRLQGTFVLHVARSGDDTDHAAIEQIVRLCETRGVGASVLLVDRIERPSVLDLERRLLFAGRRAVVVATAVPVRTGKPRKFDDEFEIEPARTATQEVSVPFALGTDEQNRFEKFLSANGAVNARKITEDYRASSSIFTLLYRLVPDARPGMQQILVNEFDSFLRLIELFKPKLSTPVRGSSLAEQLSAFVASGKLSLPSPSSPADHVDADGPAYGWTRIAREVPRAALVWASLDEPLSLDLLTRRFPELLALYRPLIDALERTGFLVEETIDRDETLGIVPRNPGIARILASAVLADSLDRLHQIKGFSESISWRDTSDLTTIPEQVQLVRVIQRISPPKGTYHHEYDRLEDLRFIARMLSDIREISNIDLPTLMLTEGIILRELAKRLEGSAERPILLAQSKTVLESARDILRARSPSRARTHQLSSILTALAATVGSIMNYELKKSVITWANCLALAQEARSTAQESQSYQETYNPIDVAFWTNRDLYLALKSTKLADQTSNFSATVEDALDGMADALDRAAEIGDMDKVQQDYFAGRLIQFESIAGNAQVARSKADDEAKAGQFSGACWIARQMAVDSHENTIRSQANANKALEYLESFAPAIFTSERATTLMQRLWLGSYLGNYRLDDGRLRIACGESDWRRFERILSARRTLLEPTRSPYVNFWLAVVAAHLGAFRQMQAFFEELSAGEIGFTRRRLAPLAYLCNFNGEIVECEGILRRREVTGLDLYVAKIGQEVRLPRRYEGLPQLTDLVRGDTLRVFVAFNYWGPVAISPNWERAEQEEKKRYRKRRNRPRR